jgi:alkanesulfonate monooxygenase SsuD/methylene tetrahydromethanopterin reductase-like flavin-dependent oxidoreductase (luciferase family)
MLVPLTRDVEFLVAFRPGLLSPTLAAQMASTYQRLSGGRLLLNIVTGRRAGRAGALRRLGGQGHPLRAHP